MKALKILFCFTFILSFLLSQSYFAKPVQAEEPKDFSFQGVSVVTMNESYNEVTSEKEIQEGDIVDRQSILYFRFSHRLFYYNIQNSITCTDSSGKLVDIRCVGGGFDTSGANIKWTRLPKKNETYTFHIKGGYDGLLDENWNPLDSDVSFSIQTNDRGPIEDTYSIVQTLNHVLAPQICSYKFYAEKGPAQLHISRTHIEYRITIMNAKDHSLALDKTIEIFVPDNPDYIYKPDFDFVLPTTGDYILTMSPINYDDSIYVEYNHVASVNLKARELIMYVNTPSIEVTPFSRYETKNKPFTVDLSTTTVGLPATTTDVFIDNKQIGTYVPNKDGSPLPIKIDPTGLTEGFHFISFISKNSQIPGNTSRLDRRFFVDRVATFKDVPSSYWAHRPIEIMNTLQLLFGRTSNLFVPDGTVTREEFATMIGRTLQLSPSGNNQIKFADTPSSWAKPYVQALAEEGIISGEIINGKRYFFPNRTITRAEATAILGRILGVSDIDVSDVDSSFKDFSSIPNWAKASVLILAENDWIHGYKDNTFKPFNTLTRAEAAQIISKFIEL